MKLQIVVCSVAVVLACVEAQEVCMSYDTASQQCTLAADAPNFDPILTCSSCDLLCMQCYGTEFSMCYVCDESIQPGSGVASSNNSQLLVCMFNETLLPGNSSLDRVECTSGGLPLGAIIGIAVGGATLLIFLCVFCVCCLCCLRRFRRRRKSFSPMPAEVEMEPSQSSDDVEKEDKAINSSIQKSASNSILPTLLPPATEGYVQMVSASSIRPSKSVGDLASNTADELYTEADRKVLSVLLATSHSAHELEQISHDKDDGPIEVYVDPQVFREDVAKDADSYYNPEVVQNLAKRRSEENGTLQEDKQNYQNIGEFVDKESDPYYNVSSLRNSGQEAEYYNVAGAGHYVSDSYEAVSEAKLLAGRRPSQDNQYIYMKSQAGSVAAGNPPHKYVNLQQHTAVSDVVYSDNTELGKSHGGSLVLEQADSKLKPSRKEEMVFPSKQVSDAERAIAEDSLYINVQHQSLVEEELYQNLPNT